MLIKDEQNTSEINDFKKPTHKRNQSKPEKNISKAVKPRNVKKEEQGGGSSVEKDHTATKYTSVDLVNAGQRQFFN
jgi:hypothetical protein